MVPRKKRPPPTDLTEEQAHALGCFLRLKRALGRIPTLEEWGKEIGYLEGAERQGAHRMHRVLIKYQWMSEREVIETDVTDSGRRALRRRTRS